MFKNGNVKILYSVDGKYDFLESGDKIQVKGTEQAASYGNSAEAMSGIEVMCKYEVVVKDYFDRQGTYYRESVEKQVGRKLVDTEKLLILEVEYASSWVFPKPEIDNK